jgi:hypothetical protein
MLPPPVWEYTIYPCYFGLSVKNFRRGPQLALIVGEVLKEKTNKPTSRAELKHQKQILMKDGVVKKNTAPAIAVKVETPESSTTSLSCYAEQRGGASAADNRRRKSRQALPRPGS